MKGTRKREKTKIVKIDKDIKRQNNTKRVCLCV